MLAGAKLLTNPKLRPYVLVPLLVNCLLFVVITSVVLTYFWAVVESGNSFVPEWLQPWIAPFAWFVWFLVAVLFLILYGYSFNVITNFIAAPFYGLLAEAAYKLLSGRNLPAESILHLLLRVFSREFSKLFYFLGRGFLVILLMLLISFIPIVQGLAPIIGILWSAWSMAIQYVDYSADNEQVPFPEMRNCLWRRSRSSLGFGSAVMLSSVIPIVNIFAMPAAVAGGTIYWLEELRSSDNTVDE